MFLHMTVEERNRAIVTAAHGFAAERYKLKHPTCTEDEAWSYAGRHWREQVPEVTDWMAVCAALQEAEESAPNN